MTSAPRLASSEHVGPSGSERVERALALCAGGASRVADAAHGAKRVTLEALYLLEADAASPPAVLGAVLLELGTLREVLGELDAAETTYRRAVALLDTSPGGEAAALRARAAARLAHLYCVQGRFEEADAVS